MVVLLVVRNETTKFVQVGEPPCFEHSICYADMDRQLLVDLIVFVGEDMSSISPFSISSHVFSSMYFPGFLQGEDGLVAMWH